ncbi:hypothetical protein PENVUL_c002G03077 [Penicillium vulpinum]|uniref:Uncharacterized protein n=2 Tax=Penicillium vulpinum TaxID=29845 RepID=A0A1V6SBZ8_9EURO|nr:hypothetical protein PENVUL_c002G03077 [Penicillium vulpinum]
MAAMTLLLAHLYSHRCSQVDNFLAAQYLGDRAMIEQAQEDMEELNRLNSDTLSARSAQLLSRLLAIEAKAAEGDFESAQSVIVQGSEIEETQSDDPTNPGKHIYIPYFGVITAGGESHADSMSSQAQTQPTSSTTSIPDSYNNHFRNKISSNKTYNNATALFAPLISGVLSDDPMRQFEYPGAAARMEDDAFQDLDLAFLDNLMRGTGDGEDSTEWAAV